MINLVQKVSFQYSNGANFLTSEEPLYTGHKICYGPIYPGDCITRLGSKKRSCFEMKKGFWLQYIGQINVGETYHLVFIPSSRECYYDKKYWFYSFAVVKDSNRLYLQTQKDAGKDIEVDEVEYIDGTIKKFSI